MRFIQRTQPFFDDLDRFLSRSVTAAAALTPNESIYESPESYIIRIDLPGYVKSEVGLKVTDRLLKLTAEPGEERSFTSKLERQWKLGDKADSSGITAKLENGVLEIAIPKAAPVTPETVEININ
ncbi:Hsp20/alpha crystallin family protein [Luteolibacter pohnpeiensis]|uniref:Hsp20/alpha crystallin family protein n=1 Tax=Luteolibacter pohnpeiensis TaxID=454153 RepID=A0A934S5B3_9BACT|nr:Hsp20/alpha crystallin family protein [Luteolibacter pohnpeiensis]MBK1882133.1 Hsp20/alpha crystallin family protein [Luteolibacter pohnpeiensis]